VNFHFYNRPPSYCDDLDAREPLDEDDDDLDLDDEADPDDDGFCPYCGLPWEGCECEVGRNLLQEDSDAEED